NIVDNHLCTSSCKLTDSASEILRRVRRVKRQLCTWSDIIHNLGHTPAFVGAARWTIFENVNTACRQVPGLLGLGDSAILLIDAIGQYSNGHPGTIDVKLGAERVGLHDLIALRDCRSGLRNRAKHGKRGSEVRQSAESADGVDWQVADSQRLGGDSALNTH